MSRLVEEVDRLSRDTERRVTGLWDRVGNGTLDEPTFVKTSARTVNRANARATVKADTITAADLRAQTGRPHRPAGIKPINDQQRLEGSIGKVIKDKPITATTPQEIQASRRKRLGRLARNEPATAAQNATKQALDHHEGLIDGWVRALGGSAVCPLCQTWADGVVRSTKVHMVRHKGCRCMPRPVAKKRKLTRKQKGLLAGAGAAFVLSPADEALVGAAGGLVAGKILRHGGRAIARRIGPPAPTIFQRLDQMVRFLQLYNVVLNPGEYAIHGSGILDALNLRRAADLDLVASDALFEQMARIPGVIRRQAGVLKDREVLDFKHRNIHAQVIKAVEHSPASRRQLTIADLSDRIKEINGVPFIDVELSSEMKLEALREGAKIQKNRRDIALLDGRLTWVEDVRAFGHRLNQTVDANFPERFFLQEYGRGSFDLNADLRNSIPLTPIRSRQVERIDAALARGRTPHRVKVYRGLRMSREEALELYADKIDTVVREKSYLSTGLREPVAHKYGQSGVYIEFDVPKGSPGYFAPYRAVAPPRTPNYITKLFGEDELLLPRGIPYRIKEIVERADGTTLIKADVLPTVVRQPPLPGLGRIYGMAAPDPAETAAALRLRFPHIDINLGASTPRNAALMRSAIERMSIRYPQVAAKLERFLVTEDIPRLTGLDGSRTPPQMMGHSVLGLSGPSGPIGQRFTIINPWFASDDEFLRAVLLREPDAFNMRDMEGVAVHELGHHVLFSLNDEMSAFLHAEARARGLPIWPDPADVDGFNFSSAAFHSYQLLEERIEAVVEDVTGYPLNSVNGKRRVAEAISRYAIDIDPDTGKVIIDELVAEAITQVMLGRYQRVGDLFIAEEPSELARSIVAFIDRGFREFGIELPDRPPRGPMLTGGREARVRKYKPGPRLTVGEPTTIPGKEAHTASGGARMHPDLIDDKKVADTIRRQARVPGFEDLAGRTDRDAFEEIMRRQVGHILDWAERARLLSPEAVEFFARWYPDTHNWLNDLADANARNGISRTGAYAVTAALSPRADWANNVAWAKWVIEAISDDVVVDRKWIQAAYDLERVKGRQAGRGGGAPRFRRELIGKHLSEIPDSSDVAYAIRARHDHDPLYQLGGRFGNPKHKAAPNDMGNITKAVAVARDGSIENIDRVLGGMKVRSFYNNLANPLDEVDFNVTIDTHHFGVANGLPFTASDPFISSGTLNITDTPTSGDDGIGGTYPLVVEATRRATIIYNEIHGTNFLPNQLQSIVWEMHRALYPSDYRTEQLLRRVGALHSALLRGQITRAEHARYVERARLLTGAPKMREILAWFARDLAGLPRLTLKEMRGG